MFNYDIVIIKKVADRINSVLKLHLLLWLFVSILCLSSSTVAVNDNLASSELEIVDNLIKKWAPLVWLAPGEKFMPGDVSDFLENVHTEKSKPSKYKGNEVDSYYYYNSNYDELSAFMQDNAVWEHRNKRNFKEKNFMIDNIELPIGEHSDNYFLVTNKNVERLIKNKSSFVYGKNPSMHNVPIYAMANLCSSKNYFSDLDNEISVKIEYKKNPYIPISIKFNEENIQHFYSNNNGLESNFQITPEMNKTQTPTNRNIVKRMVTIETEVKTIDNSTSRNIDSNNETERQPTSNKEIYQTYTPLQKISINKIDEQNSNQLPKFHVTYWMFYPYSQGKQMCTLSLGPLGNVPIPLIFGMCLGTRKYFGSHVGDWEHMTLFFDGTTVPQEMYVSAHDAGAYYSYDKLTETFEFRKQETRKGILQHPIFPRTVVTSSYHPVLFAALGSHGLWTAPGKHRFVRVPRLYDINGFGTPWPTWKNVEIVYENMIKPSNPPSWLQFRGRWGNPKSKCHPLRKIGLHFCEFSDGPTGIPKKPSHFSCGTNDNSF